jgi:phage-related protein
MLLGSLIVRIGADFSPLTRDLMKVEGMAKKSGTTVGDIFKNAVGVGLGISFTKIADASLRAAKDFVLTAGRTETLNVALGAVATSARKSMTSVLGHKDAVMDMGIAEQEATQILTRFMQAQLDTADAAKLARVAQDAAVVAGYNSSEAAEQMTEAIAKQRPQLLAAFGMTRNLNDIYADYAKTAGKTANKLTESEKKQAMLNYILKEGEKVAGAYEKSMGSAFKKLGSLTRYWDTFKNAIATPLALPSFGEIIDMLTNALKSAIKWAETNKAVLEAWGKTIATSIKNGITTAWNAVSGFFNFIKSNWNIFAPVIKGALTLFVSFKIVTLAINASELATKALTTAQLILAGQSSATSGILGFLNTVVIYYKVQMLSAAGTTGVFTGALYSLKAALISVWTALGPIGWVILAIAGVLGVGIGLWNRYNASLRAASQTASQADLAKGFRDIEKSSQAAADGIGDQTDAMGKSKKAASDNLTAFDEINKLQADMGDADMALDTPTLDEMIMPEMPDMGGMFAGLGGELDGIKPTLAGFWDWIKQGASNTWESIKTKSAEAWSSFTGFLKNVWAGIVDSTRPIWEPIGTFFSGLWSIITDDSLTWWEKIKGVLSYIWQTIVDVARPIWEPIAVFLSGLWEGIKTVAITVWDFISPYLQRVWNGIATAANIIWTPIATFFKGLWEGIKTVAVTVWDFIKPYLEGAWNGISIAANIAWELIKKFIVDPINTIKEVIIGVWGPLSAWIIKNWEGIKEKTLIIWGAIKKYIIDPIIEAKNTVVTWIEYLRNKVIEKWDSLVTGVKNIKDTLYKYLIEPFATAKKTILDVVKDAKEWGRNLIQNIIDGIKSKINAVKNAVSNVASTIKGYIGFSSPTKEGPGRYADEWAPNLIKMYADGIIRNVGLVESAASTVAGSLSPMSGGPSGGFDAGAGGGGDTTIIVKIGEDTITEKIISNINRQSLKSGKAVILV